MRGLYAPFSPEWQALLPGQQQARRLPQAQPRPRGLGRGLGGVPPRGGVRRGRRLRRRPQVLLLRRRLPRLRLRRSRQGPRRRHPRLRRRRPLRRLLREQRRRQQQRLRELPRRELRPEAPAASPAAAEAAAAAAPATAAAKRSRRAQDTGNASTLTQEPTYGLCVLCPLPPSKVHMFFHASQTFD